MKFWVVIFGKFVAVVAALIESIGSTHRHNG